MARHNKSPKTPDIDDTEHVLFRQDGRAYTPSDGEGAGGRGMLVERSTGDWSWKPQFDKAIGIEFRTYEPGPHLRYCEVCKSHYCSCPA